MVNELLKYFLLHMLFWFYKGLVLTVTVYSRCKLWDGASVMQSDCSRYLHSVSDLYAADEISVLLEEIRELEPASYRPEDLQDFEIAGSQTGNI